MPFGIGEALGSLFGGGGSYPKPPNATKTANRQFDYNRDAAFQSLINQQGPFGSLSYSRGPGGSITANTTLGDFGQRAYQGAGDWLAKYLQNYGGGAPDFSADRGRIEDTLYDRFSSRLDPQYQDREREMLSRLEAQGITQGSQAYQRALDDFGRERRSAYDEARQSAVLGGGAEQSRLFDMFSRQRGQDFGDIGGLFGLSAAGVPQAIGHAGIGAPDYMGAVYNNYQGQIGAYNADQARQAANTQGLFNLGGTLGAAAILSSRTLKTEIGEAPSVLDKLETLPVKVWAYKEHIGPYAEEWAERFGGDGQTINVIDMMGVVIKAIQELRQEVRARA